jgi:hypothetical protein
MAKSTSKLFESETPTEMKEDAMNLPTESSAVESSTTLLSFPNDDIQDIDISAIKKRRFRINGDSSKIIELNVSDMNISQRLKTSYDNLLHKVEEVSNVLGELPDDESEATPEQEKLVEEKLREIDAEMKKEVDYIFQTSVSDVCCDGGSMYDPFNGMFRFEHIIEALIKLYDNNIDREFDKMRKRVNTKTSKYTKKYHN